MTRIAKISMAGLAVVVALTAGQSQAGDKATTRNLPPALAAMGLTDSEIMDRSEADEIRGEGLFLLGNAFASVNAGASAVAIVPGVAKVGAAAAVNLNVGLGLNAGLLNRGGCRPSKCY